MNFLAHTFLSGDNEGWIVGNFLGDFLRNKQVQALPSAVREGVKLHRLIDTFTDQHPSVLQGVRRLYPEHHKYASVLMDVYYDHLLTQNWAQYSQEPLHDFAGRAYEVLLRHRHLMPEPVSQRLQRMISDNWLSKYGTFEGLDFAFQRMRHFVSAPTHLDGAVESLKLHMPQLQEEFGLFFPDLIAAVNAFRQ
ncbi:MAG: DUF479 domain-containing protein [Saprospiraceae bacterium]|nr:DUF479 domain-containing protein [Saprospiraceae bacterium]